MKSAPEVTILGVGKAQTRVMWDGAQAVPRLVLPLSLNRDHRAVDSAAAGRFNDSLAQVSADSRVAILMKLPVPSAILKGAGHSAAGTLLLTACEFILDRA